jgi:hypothetical protein
MKKRKPSPELPRIYVRPSLDRRQLEAKRAFFDATCRGERARPKPDTVDPLQMRLGLRARLITQRAGWVVSNPGYSDSLDRNPAADPSLPVLAWLHELYRWRDGRELCTLPGVRAVIENRLRLRLPRVVDECEPRNGDRQQQAEPSAQLTLFA